MNSQLGWQKPDARTTTQLTPRKVGGLTTWTKVAAGDNHSLGLAGGNLWGWGQNVLGQVGNGSNLEVTSPIKLGSEAWTAIAAAGSTSAGIKSVGARLFVWGSNDKGQLGDGGTQPTSTPKEFVAAGVLSGFSAVALSPTSLAAIAVTSAVSPNVWVAGSNEGGRLGEDRSVLTVKTPRLLSSLVVGSISIGGEAGSAIDGDGDLVVWGSNGYGQLQESVIDLLAHAAIVGEAPGASGSLSAITSAGVTGVGAIYKFEEGETVSFYATLTGTPPFAYQWRRNEVNINGATSARYDLPATGANDGAIYDIMVTNTYASNVVTDTVQTVLWVAPEITRQPANANALNGVSTRLTVVATGSSLNYPLNYEWQLDGTSLSSGTVAFYDASVAGTYRVIVSSDKNGSPRSVTSSSAVVGFFPQITLASAIELPLSVKVGPSGPASLVKSLKSGQVLALSVEATGTSGTPNYQWRRDLQEIQGATLSTLNVTASAASSGVYDVVVSNPAVSVTSSSVALLVYSSPVFTRQPASQIVQPTKGVSLTVSALGYDLPTLQWFGPNGRMTGETSSTLLVSNFSEGTAGDYYVVATNLSGSTTSGKATLALPVPVQGKPTVTSQPQSQAVVEGGSAFFSVSAVGATQYQWRKNGVPIPGETGTRLVFSSVQAVDVASYSVLVSNSVTSVLSTAATISLRKIVDGDARRSLFNAVVGSNGGLFAARLSGTALPSGTAEGYLRLNFTRAGTVSGLYTSGSSVYRFSARLAISKDTQVALVPELVPGSGSSTSGLRLTVTGDASNPVAAVQLVPSGSASVTTTPVPLARLGVKNLTLSSVYTSTFQNPTDGSFKGYSSVRVNLSSGNVAVSGMLPETGQRFTASSTMYADPAGLSPASMTDLIVRLSASKRLFSTWKLETATVAGDAVVVTGATSGTKYDVTGARYTPAALGALLVPFVSTRDQALVTRGGVELARFTAAENRLLPAASSFAAAGGRFSVRFTSSTGIVSGLVSLSGTPGVPPVAFTGVILQGEYRSNGGILRVAVTQDGSTLQFEPAN